MKVKWRHLLSTKSQIRKKAFKECKYFRFVYIKGEKAFAW